ncbi:hypothetical protein GE061_003736 [Apolygus lucorum]|uniref:Uncharacterized protein n=1 Tax=Apolygus lucorum TaxID=248454 RepID=A0A8S9X4M0_APOLU|nr:hypothetical protein GE061_003736 [Apolygus lucorum]
MGQQPSRVWSHLLWSRHLRLRLLRPRGPTLPQVPAPPEIRSMVVRSQVAFPRPCFLEKPVSARRGAGLKNYLNRISQKIRKEEFEDEFLRKSGFDHRRLVGNWGSDRQNLKKVADECKKVSGNEHFTVVGSLEKEEDTRRILKETIDKYSKLDVLVNNAGIVELGSIETTSLEQYDRVFGVNVRALYHLTMLATPYLVKSKGNIVNVSSVNGLRSFAGVLAYNMSKSAVDQFTKCVALELAPKQVRVNSVNPGVIITELQKRGGLDDAAYAKFLERSKETHALGRPGDPEEVADSILFLASDQASFITATHLSENLRTWIATAIKFAKLGASLSLTGRKAEQLKKVADECKKVSGNENLTIIGSLEAEEDTRKILKATIDKYGKLDVLVNNAGVMELGSIETTSLEQYDRVFGVNVRALYHLTMLATPYLVKSKGNIVNVSSVLGLTASAGLLAYSMSKSTVDQFTKCVALELAPKQVRVNSVNPGVIVTELQKRGGLDDASYAKFLERSKETHPLGRPGNPEEVADSILFLASDQASFITATHLSVDGGKHVFCPR